MNAYFGFKRSPFSKDIKTEDMFDFYDTKEALARLNHIKQHRGIILLTGEPGSGKTSVLRRFVNNLNPQSYVHHYTPHATVTKTEFYRQLNLLLKLPPRIYKAYLFEQIQHGIWDLYEHQGKIPCILLDEAHMMDNDTLQELVLLTNFQMDSKTPFILVLTGQPVLKDRLKLRIHEPLNQRILLRYHMIGLTAEETRNYILHHLKIAGRKDQLFEENSFEVIQQISLGLPRKIGNIALASMTYSMVKQLKTIDADAVLKASAGL